MTNEETNTLRDPVLLMIEHEVARRCVEEKLANSAFNVLPTSGRDTDYDFTALSDQGCVIVADIDGFCARDGADMSNGHEYRTGADLPVILLLTQKQRDRLDDKVRQRVNFCLIKPVSKKLLSTIVQAASAEHARIADLRNEALRRKSAIGKLVSGEFEIRTLEETRNLATMLSLACPIPENAAIGMAELMVNAIEHGNLGIGFGLKSKLLSKGEWHSEITRRLNLEENRGKKVIITLKKTSTEIEFRVIDEGAGFNRNAVMSGISDPFRTHGRGILIAETQCFDSLEYQGRGNVAVGIIRIELAS